MMTNVWVADGALTEPEFVAFNQFAREIDKQQSVYGQSVFQNNDENPFESKTSFFFRPAADKTIEQLLPKGVTVQQLTNAGLRIAPTHTPMDALFEAVTRRRPEIEGIIGKFDQDWIGMIAKIYAYPCHAKSVWHTDEGPYTGAFVYYAHHEWKPDWGGQFLWHDDEIASKNHQLVDGKYATCSPNRIVVVRSGTPHMISNVGRSAGTNLRLSVSGFFLKSGGIGAMLRGAARANSVRANAAGP